MLGQIVADLAALVHDIRQGALIPTAHTVGTDFKPAPRQPLDEVFHLDGW